MLQSISGSIVLRFLLCLVAPPFSSSPWLFDCPMQAYLIGPSISGSIVLRFLLCLVAPPFSSSPWLFDCPMQAYLIGPAPEFCYYGPSSWNHLPQSLLLFDQSTS